MEQALWGEGEYKLLTSHYKTAETVCLVLDKEDFEFRIELAQLQSEIGVINSAAISMLGAAVGATIATIGLGGITNFNEHPVELAGLFGIIGLLGGVGMMLFWASSKRFENRKAGLKEKYVKTETTQDKSLTPATP